MNNYMINCERFDELLPELLEESATPETRSAADAHLRECARCTRLLSDLRAIQRDARALPALSPSRDLWSSIEARIQPAVLSLSDADRTTRTPMVARRRRLERLSGAGLAAAAAALIIATSGITYTATRWSMNGDPVQVAASPTVTAPTATILATPSVESTGATAPVAVPDTRLVMGPGLDVPTRSTQPNASGSEATLAIEAPYTQEIASLHAVMRERRDQLDPYTVALVEQNLRLIDLAIAESRAALSRDPASGFLSQQLTHALNKKVELLRTIALLPART